MRRDNHEILIVWILIVVILELLILTSVIFCKCPPGGCGNGVDYWQQSAEAFLNSEAPIVKPVPNQDFNIGSFKVGEALGFNSNYSVRSSINADSNSSEQSASNDEIFLASNFLQPLGSYPSTSSVLEVSDQTSTGDAHLKGAISLPAKSFLNENGSLRTISEMSSILSKSGVSRNDSVIVYSDNFGSGEAAFVFWVLRYLGHDNVKILDGGLKDWTAASLPMETKKNVNPTANYSSNPRYELLATYQYVISGSADIVDARSFQEFGKQRIPKAFSILPDSILDNGVLRSRTQLNDISAMLDKKRPVVVYSNDFFSSSLVWFALQLMGYDARLYTWQDWQKNKIS